MHHTLPHHSAQRWRDTLSQGRLALKQDFLATGAPRELLTRHAGLVDAVLAGLWLDSNLPDTLCLAAVGGYGRGELYPFSDVDVLILLPRTMDDAVNARLERFVGLLWDCGLEIGHSVRSIAECIEEADRDVTVLTTLLESRRIAGDAKLFTTLEDAIKQHLDVPRFFSAKVAEQQARYARYQDTAHNLEPNIKENPGGLRDLQLILWIGRAAALGSNWQELARRGLLTRVEARQAARRERILSNLRIRLHYLANRREDRLLFDLQAALAEELNLAAHKHRLPSERLMQAFYRTAKAVCQLNTILLQNLSAQILFKLDAPAAPINEDFFARNRLLEARQENLYQSRPAAILESFLLLQQYVDIDGIGAATLRALWRAKTRINADFRRDRGNQDLFMQILREPRRVTFVLRLMNQYGILGRYIAAFGRIVGQMQHDLFHVYTVDAHILMVVRNLRRLGTPQFAHEHPFPSQLMSEFERPEVLIVAALFHDIGKGRGGDHSKLGAVDARRFCRQHRLPEDDAALVRWLVEEHLTMSAVAQKQDLSDPAVINAFATKVGDLRRLEALYLLTVADIRGTSPKVWNAWKAKLIEDLFRNTRRVLRDGEANVTAQIAAKRDKALTIVRQYALGETVHEALWARLNDGYFQRFDANDIAWHTRMLAGKVDSAAAIVKARLSPIGEGIQVLIYSPDQEALFARICSFFERTAYNVVDAKIYTTGHGYALDSFQVLDRASKATHYRDLLSYIEFELGQRINKQAPLEPPLQTRVSRHLQHFPITPQLDIESEGSGGRHRLSLVAGDRPGLLSAIARVLVRHKVSLHDAKITTLGERAEDVLQVSGAVFDDAPGLAAFREDLLDCLRT